MKQFVVQQFRDLAASAAIDATRDSVIRTAFPGIATPQQRLPQRGTPYSDDEVYAAWLAERAEIVFARNNFITTQPAISDMTVEGHKYQFYLNVLSFVEVRFPQCYELLNRLPTQRRGQDVRYDIVNNPIDIFVNWIRPKIAISVLGSINSVVSDIPSMYVNAVTKAGLLDIIARAQDDLGEALKGITQAEYTTFLQKYATVLDAKYGEAAKPKFKSVQHALIALMSLERVGARIPGYIQSVVDRLPPRLQGSKYSDLMNAKIKASADNMAKQIANDLSFRQEGIDEVLAQINRADPASPELVARFQSGGRRKGRRKTFRRRKVPNLL
jgi:hypothetical protein